MAKYDIILEETRTQTSEEIIETYELTDKEVEIMKYLYKKQYRKEELLERFYYVWSDMTQSEVSKVFGSLKKKGFIYSVVDLQGWLGTDIKI